MKNQLPKKVRKILQILLSCLIFYIALYFFLIPTIILIHDIQDPGLHNGEIPQFSYRWHRKLTPKFEKWATHRVASEDAAELELSNISGTEWPLLCALHYLLTTEALQEQWDENKENQCPEPVKYAKEAVEAAAALLVDPNHATWVKAHWGETYLGKENLFYRMLLIKGLASYQKITGDDQYQAFLLDQTQGLAAELDASQFGLLDDYPGQCYPVDILPAYAAIKRADQVLGTNHSAMLRRGIRAFKGPRLDIRTGLPAYIADPETGFGVGPSRGVGISYMLIWAPELWPDLAEKWVELYRKYYWQRGWFCAGFREFSKNSAYTNWAFYVDAGPVIGGLGTTVSAFGLGAARTNGQMDQAYVLAAQALIVSWPLPNGTRLGPRILSNLSDAPYVGETALLMTLSRTPVNTSSPTEKSTLTPFVYVGIALYGLIGLVMILMVIRFIRKTYFYIHLNKI